VDDEPDFSELVQYRLAEEHFDFATTTNSTDALNSAWEQPPDLILLDLLLPDLDGLSVCEIFARHPATQHIPVIALTAHAMSSDRDKALEAGCDDYDTKPVELPRLLGKIEALLNGGAGQTAAAGEPSS